MGTLIEPRTAAAPASPAAVQRPPASVDLACLGEPGSGDDREAWQREARLLREAGWRLLERRAKGSAVLLDAPVALVAEAGALAGIRLASPETQIVLRHMGKRAAAVQPLLERRLKRRVMVAPAHALERQALLARLPGRALTAEDWPPVLAAERLHEAARRPCDSPFTIGVIGASDGHLGLERLSTSLAGLGVDREAVRLLALDAAAVEDTLLARLHVLVGPARCEDPAIPALVLRALEAGVLPLLSDGWKPALRDAAVFQDWATLPTRLAALALDRSAWRRLLRERLDRAQARYGEEAFLDRMRAGFFGAACPPHPAAGGRRRTTAAAMPVTADLLLIGDFRRREEAVEQLLPQIARHAAAGRSVLLCQAWNGRPGPTIHPGIDACLRQGRARLAGPGDLVRAKAAAIIVPRLTVPALEAMRPAIMADHWHIVEIDQACRDYDPAALQATIGRLYGAAPIWHAAQPAMQATLAARVPVESRLWPVQASPGAKRRQRPGTRFRVGVQAWAPADAAAAMVALAGTAQLAAVDRHVLLVGTQRSFDVSRLPPVEVLTIDGTDIARFVAGLDLLVVPPVGDLDRLPRRAIAEALAMGIPVLAPAALEPDLPAGPVFLATTDWTAFVTAAAGRRRTRQLPAATVDAIDLAPRLALATGITAPASLARRTRRVLFVTANGVGLGHITRLSAIARRLPDRLEPVFATMSQAASVLEDMGFATELLTTYNGKSGKPWNAWTRERMREILDFHQPAALVLDASNPYEGVVAAAACRPDLKLVWVRRGMWRATQDNSEFLSRAPYFDLVIEPDDIAAALDVARLGQGPGEALEVPPIGLLDEAEILPRVAARQALGLPETSAGGSVLVQLGSGTTRDLNRLLSQVIDTLRCFPGLEIVLAQWLNTTDDYRGRWRDVRLLTGFPIPRYYRAFDFTISAAGYNSFNDLLRFGVPTIFIANDAECMDDQGARARHAEAEGAAFDIQETSLEALYDCVQAILQPPVRAYLGERARALARPNGAAAAARAIARLLA
jgi:UDP:flavonoid glycosyltransferase YjiC (YdhE family)